MITKIGALNCENLTAIVACPSIGNVGQLSTDLLVSNLDAEYVGMAWHPGLLPLAGGDPYHNSSTKICTSNDFYLSRAQNLLFVQLRAPVLQKLASDFTSKLVEVLTGLGVRKVVILSGMFSHGRDDTEIRAGSFRYVLNSFAENEANSLALSWVRLTGNEPENGSSCPKLRGTGFTRTLLNVCTQKSIPCVALLYFCSEGDNLQDSLQFTLKINEWLNILPNINKIEKPISWEYLFGNERPKDMY
uniref:Proteasome assembly chaperone 2 n=1 Tax=Lygus hesperus TaxID=30085 RepID=A0A146LW07_LYGHE